jgi:hypothetical protein
VIFALLGLFLLSSPFIYVKGTLVSLEKKVRHYLITERNIDEKLIVRIDGVFGKLPVFGAEVVFADEPDVRYYYTERNGKIIPLQPSFKHRGYKYKHK